MAAFEIILQLAIEHTGSYLRQPMGVGHRPLRLLLLDEPLADDLVDSSLGKTSRHRFAVPVMISIIRFRRHVVRCVVHEIVEFIQIVASWS